MKNFDVVSVGDAIIDTFLTIHEANVHCRLNDKDCELCIKYGEKIQIDQCEFLLGGNACNVSVSLARLGVRSALCAEIGDDEFAQKILKGLLVEKVDQTLVKQTQGGRSSFAIGINFKGERTLFVAHMKREHDFDLSTTSTKWVYLTSLGREWKNAYQRVIQRIAKGDVRLAFNPGTPQLEEGLGSFREVLDKTYVLFVNKKEAEVMVGEQKDMRMLLTQLQTLGPSIVVITDGINGSFCLADGKMHRLGIMPATLVERTGAGDGYTAGFLGALILGQDAPTAMRWGGANAAAVVQKIGAQAGLLKVSEIDTVLGTSDAVQVEML